MTRISAETAALLRRLRVQYRDRPTIYRDLVTLSALTQQANTHSSRAHTTELDIENPPQESLSLTTAQAADMTGLRPDTIRKACRQQRLRATRTGRDWTITRTALAEWMQRRAA